MPQDWMNEIAPAVNEVKEGEALQESAEAEALEPEVTAREAEAVRETTNEVPDSIMDVLQLSESEKQAYQNIGIDVENMQVEGTIIGYKQGACTTRLIPIKD